MRKMAGMFVLLLLFVGCGSTWDNACAAAEHLVADWDAAELNCYRYECHVEQWEGERRFAVELQPCEEAFADAGQLREHLSAERVAQCVASVYPDLTACFKGFSVHTVFVVCDEEGNARYTFVDGELET